MHGHTLETVVFVLDIDMCPTCAMLKRIHNQALVMDRRRFRSGTTRFKEKKCHAFAWPRDRRPYLFFYLLLSLSLSLSRCSLVAVSFSLSEERGKKKRSVMAACDDDKEGDDLWLVMARKLQLRSLSLLAVLGRKINRRKAQFVDLSPLFFVDTSSFFSL